MFYLLAIIIYYYLSAGYYSCHLLPFLSGHLESLGELGLDVDGLGVVSGQVTKQLERDQIHWEQSGGALVLAEVDLLWLSTDSGLDQPSGWDVPPITTQLDRKLRHILLMTRFHLLGCLLIEIPCLNVKLSSVLASCC